LERGAPSEETVFGMVGGVKGGPLEGAVALVYDAASPSLGCPNSGPEVGPYSSIALPTLDFRDRCSGP